MTGRSRWQDVGGDKQNESLKLGAFNISGMRERRGKLIKRLMMEGYMYLE